MALPSSYTEATLVYYMLESLGDLATTLGVTEARLYETVNDVALACNVTDIANATDIVQVRALARVAALRVAQTTAATWYDFSADGGDYKRSQVMAQIERMTKAAEAAAMQYDNAYAVGTGVLSYAGDPYDWDAEDADAAGVG